MTEYIQNFKNRVTQSLKTGPSSAYPSLEHALITGTSEAESPHIRNRTSSITQKVVEANLGSSTTGAGGEGRMSEAPSELTEFSSYDGSFSRSDPSHRSGETINTSSSKNLSRNLSLIEENEESEQLRGEEIESTVDADDGHYGNTSSEDEYEQCSDEVQKSEATKDSERAHQPTKLSQPTSSSSAPCPKTDKSPVAASAEPTAAATTPAEQSSPLRQASAQQNSTSPTKRQHNQAPNTKHSSPPTRQNAKSPIRQNAKSPSRQPSPNKHHPASPTRPFLASTKQPRTSPSRPPSPTRRHAPTTAYRSTSPTSSSTSSSSSSSSSDGSESDDDEDDDDGTFEVAEVMEGLLAEWRRTRRALRAKIEDNLRLREENAVLREIAEELLVEELDSEDWEGL